MTLLPFLIMIGLVILENTLLVVEVLGLIIGSGFLLARTKQLQEFYYYGISQIDFDGLNANIDILAFLDGTMKEIKIHSVNVVSWAGGSGKPMLAYSLRRHDTMLMFVGDAATAYENPFIAITLGGVQSNFAHSGPSHLMAHLMPLDDVSNTHSFYRARISNVTKKNEQWNIKINRQEVGGTTAATSGTSEVRWEIKQVSAAWVYMFDQSKPMGIRFRWIINIGVSSTTEIASVEFPCAGYLTNMSLLVEPSGNGDFPSYVYFGTDDTDSVDHLLTVAGTNGVKGSNQNSIVFELMLGRDVDGTSYDWLFQHFGSKYIRLVNRAMLNFLFRSQGADSPLIILEADFIPFKGAQWKQVYSVETDMGDTGSDWEAGFEFATDLDGCQVTVVATIASGEEGIMTCKIVDPSPLLKSSLGQNRGDVQDSTPFDGEGIHNAQNLAAMIPLSGSMGAAAPVLGLGNITGGQLFTWDFMSPETLTTASELFFIITGKVGKEYYSTANMFILSPGVLDYATLNAAVRSF